MLTGLDAHSSYLNPKAFKDMQVQTRGSFGGLGIEVTMENGVIKVVSPIDDTPAAKAGIQAGDRIVGIEGQPIYTWSQMTGLVRDNPQKPLRVDVLRNGQRMPLTVTPATTTTVVRSSKARCPIAN